MDVIDTSVMPGDDMDPDAIDAAAATIRASGASVSGTATATHAAWQPISGAYEAPEQGQLYAAMNPVRSEGETFQADLASAATALETFADTVRTIKAAVVQIRADVASFENKIASDGTIQPAGGYNPYAGGMKLRIQWNEDKGMVAEQHALAGRINAQVDALRAAEIACANSIDDITGAAHVPTSGPGAPPAPPHVADAQWYLTAPIDRKEDCGQRIAHGVVIDFAGGAVTGLLGFAGIKFDTTTGKFGNWADTLGESWGGLVKLGVGSSPLAPVILRQLGAGKYADESQRTFWAFLNDQIARDPYAEDPWHRYKEDPLRAGGYTAASLATWLLPPLKALTAGKVAKVGELAGDAAKAGDLAKAGGATRFASAADLVKALRESGSLSRLSNLSDVLRAKFAVTAGKASDLAHLGDDLTTPKLSQYDLTGHRANPHAEVPPVRDGLPVRDQAPVREPAGVGAPDHGPRTGGAGSGTTHDVPAATPDKGPGAGGEPQPGDGHNQGHGLEPGQEGPVPPAPVHPDVPVADHATRQAPRTDPLVVKEVGEVREAVAPRLRDIANEAWGSANDKSLPRYTDWVEAHPGRTPSSGVIGSWAHKDLATLVGERLIPEGSGYRLRSEVSFDSRGVERPNGFPGTVRPDLVLERERIVTSPQGVERHTWEVAHVWDYKTGDAQIAKSWARNVAARTRISVDDIERLGVG